MAGGNRFLFASTMFLVLAGAGSFAWALAASMTPAADAGRPLVVNLSTIPPGERRRVRWQGREYFILHRTAEQVAAARAGDGAAMPSPEPDSARVQRAEWLVVEARPDRGYFYPPQYRMNYRGKYGGWYAPGGEQHYDLSGRLREAYRGSRNLPVPAHYFLADGVLVIE